MNKFYGKYRGKVLDTADRLNRGRVKVSVPSVMGPNGEAWAMPCVPYAGKQVGTFLLPPVGANAWVEFEGGDPDFPIVAGYFWEDNEVPAKPAREETKVIKTDLTTITLSDKKGDARVVLETNDGMKVLLNPKGIEITTGQGATVKLQGNKVSINDTAFEVM